MISSEVIRMCLVMLKKFPAQYVAGSNPSVPSPEYLKMCDSQVPMCRIGRQQAISIAFN